MSIERSRVLEQAAAWRRWGPYLSERQWGTVREDYSPSGDAWESFPHDHAHRRVYRWGEDGLAGFSDERQRLCMSLALWNGSDPILKERLFGLTNGQGNHGEDVKELYYYLDATPSHSYLKMLYKYPQREFPYSMLVEKNRRRGKSALEYELLDSGVLDNDRYFDVFIEYAKAAPDDILMQVTALNRGPDRAELHLLPQAWFRNTWSWEGGSFVPQVSAADDGSLVFDHPDVRQFRLWFDGPIETLFCDNETNVARVFGVDAGPGSFKDGFHNYLVEGEADAVNRSSKTKYKIPDNEYDRRGV